MRRPKIKIRGSSRSWYYFIIVAENGRTIAQSETYHRKRDALATAAIFVDRMSSAVIVDESADAPARESR